MKTYNLTWTRDSYNGTCCALIIKASDEATAKAYFTEHKPDAEIVGISEGCDMKPGKPVLEVPEGWEPKKADEPRRADSQGAYIDRLRTKWPFRIVAHGGYEAVLCGVQPLNDGQPPLPVYRFPGGPCVVFDGEIENIVEW